MMAAENKWIMRLLQARFLVAALGETASPAWWRSDATAEASRRFLERLYPRTFLNASLETATRAAAVVHDTYIGAIGAYHLFRLPVADETDLHAYLLSSAGLQQMQELIALPDTEARMALLDHLSQGTMMGDLRGPMACGSIADLQGDQLLHRLCAAYSAGFANCQPIYPYLVKADGA